MILIVEKLWEHFKKKSCKINKKGDKIYMSSGEAMIIHLIDGLKKKDIVK